MLLCIVLVVLIVIVAATIGGFVGFSCGGILVGLVAVFKPRID
jgi:hypothetical protein